MLRGRSEAGAHACGRPSAGPQGSAEGASRLSAVQRGRSTSLYIFFTAAGALFHDTRLRNHFVIWPVYFDAGRTRKEGRRVPKDIALKKPSVEWIMLAARELDLPAQIDPEASHPSAWWKKNGRVLVEKDELEKGEVLKSLALKMKELGRPDGEKD